MSDKWLVVPYGNAVVDGKPESEWGWMVNRDDDSESIEVESRRRAEQIAAFLNEDALRLARDLRSKATSIDGWCSSCEELGKHRSWCPWTRLLAILDDTQNAQSEKARGTE